MSKSAAALVADAVLEIEDEQERERMSFEIAAHAAAMLVMLVGPERATETMYRIADAAVRQSR